MGIIKVTPPADSRLINRYFKIRRRYEIPYERKFNGNQVFTLHDWFAHILAHIVSHTKTAAKIRLLIYITNLCHRQITNGEPI